MEPVTTVTTAWTIAKTVGEISKKLYEFGKSLKDRDARHELDQILDHVRGLKQSASELEDENRELREKLRFNSDEFEFKNPLWLDKKHPDRALCPKCFSKQIIAPVAEPYDNGVAQYRQCLSCGTAIEVGQTRHRAQQSGFYPGGGSEDWMR